jgi:hypothetical protein
MALIAIGIGSVIVLPIAISTSSNLVNAQKATQSLKEQYAVSAGLEDAIWNLTWGDFQSTVLNVTGTWTEYTLDDSINGNEVDINIERVASLPVARDDMDSGGLLGGLNWATDWLAIGSANVVSSGEPYEGSHHFRIGTIGTARRSVDTTDLDEVFLRFRAKATELLPGDDIDLKVSSNGTNWVTVESWDDSDSDDVYRYYEIDLSEYSTSSNFWISFEGVIVS